MTRIKLILLFSLPFTQLLAYSAYAYYQQHQMQNKISLISNQIQIATKQCQAVEEQIHNANQFLLQHSRFANKLTWQSTPPPSQPDFHIQIQQQKNRTLLIQITGSLQKEYHYLYSPWFLQHQVWISHLQIDAKNKNAIMIIEAKLP